MILGLEPVLKIIREVRPAPGRAFITGVLGFDDACKHFEESSHWNDQLRLEEKRAAFQKRVKEQSTPIPLVA